MGCKSVIRATVMFASLGLAAVTKVNQKFWEKELLCKVNGLNV